MIRIIKKVFGSVFCIIWLSGLAGCVNNFAKFYQDNFANEPDGRPENLEFYSGQPKLLQGANREEDRKRMIEYGYVPIGVSSFNAASAPVDDAIAVARDKGAEYIVFYAKRPLTTSGNTPYIFQHHAALLKGSGRIDDGATTIYDSPNSLDRPDFLVTYWSKNKRIRFGTLVKDLPEDMPQHLEGIKGAVVDIVIKDTPAFTADVRKGDIITRIDGQEIIGAKDFIKKLKTMNREQVDLEILRNGKSKLIQVKLN